MGGKNNTQSRVLIMGDIYSALGRKGVTLKEEFYNCRDTSTECLYLEQDKNTKKITQAITPQLKTNARTFTMKILTSNPCELVEQAYPASCGTDTKDYQ
jgi:hypothetical protein